MSFLLIGRRWLGTAIIIFCFGACANSQTYKTEKQENSLNSIISEAIIPIDSTDADFSFLGSEIGDKNIVVLGEAGHGHGTTFKLKQKIIEYLHEEKGFDYLVMEGVGTQ